MALWLRTRHGPSFALGNNESLNSIKFVAAAALAVQLFCRSPADVGDFLFFCVPAEVRRPQQRFCAFAIGRAADDERARIGMRPLSSQNRGSSQRRIVLMHAETFHIVRLVWSIVFCTFSFSNKLLAMARITQRVVGRVRQ